MKGAGIGDGVLQDLRLCLRRLAREPSFSLVAIVSLALSVGFISAAYSFMDAVFLRPFPTLPESERLMSIFVEDEKASLSLPLSFTEYDTLSHLSRSFSGLIAYQAIKVGLATGVEPAPLYGEVVSGNFFDVLGVQPLVGRTFLPAEDRAPGGSPVVVLSFRLWLDRLGGDPRVLGKVVRINGRPFTVVGVAPRGFAGTSAVVPAAFWIPLATLRQFFDLSPFADAQSVRLLQVAGRLQRGVDAAQAAAELRVIGARLAQAYPQEEREHALALAPFTDMAIPPYRRPLFLRAGALVSGLVVLLLLMSCINISNLQMVRTLGRQRELAVRLALGGGRMRLMRPLLLESFLLVVLGGGASLWVAAWMRQMLWVYKPAYFADDALLLRTDSRALGFALLVSLLAGLLFVLAPSLEAFKPELISKVRARGSEGHGSELRTLFRHGALVLQVGLCLLCLYCAGLFIRYLENTRHIDPGFDASRLLVVSFDLGAAGYDAARVGTFEAELLERTRRLPGVESASLAETRVLGGWTWSRDVSRAGAGAGAAGGKLSAGSSHVGADYFRTTGIPILAGRSLTDRDGARVVVLNQTLAKRLWPDASAVGGSLQIDEEPLAFQVVGVARDAKYGTLSEPPQPFVYLPLPRQGTPQATLHLRARHPASLAAAARNELRRMSGSSVVPEIQLGSEIVEQSLRTPRAGAVLLSIFGAVATVIAAIGVFGVASYSANRRQFEIGLRIALGAQPASVLALVLRRGVALIGLGVTLGILSSLSINHWMSGLLPFALSDGLLSLAGAGSLFLVIGLIANLVPAIRTAQIGPALPMRVDQS